MIHKEEIPGWVKVVPEMEEGVDAAEEEVLDEVEEVEEIIILAKNAEAAGPVEGGEKRDRIRPQDLQQHQVDPHFQLRLRLHLRHPHRQALVKLFLEKPPLVKSQIWD